MKIIHKSIINQYEIRYKKQARDELDRIYLYIRKRLKEDKIAQRTIDNIRGKISNLRYFPYAHKLLRKTKKFEYRKFIIKNKKSKIKKNIVEFKNNKNCSKFMMSCIK